MTFEVIVDVFTRAIIYRLAMESLTAQQMLDEYTKLTPEVKLAIQGKLREAGIAI